MSSNRIVVKVGSSLLAYTDTLRLRYSFMGGLISDLAHLRSQGYDVVLMSSGAVALGCQTLRADPHGASVEVKQAASAVGQPILINAYKQIAHEMGCDIAQVLVSLTEMESREHFENISATLENLFEFPVIPIVNENDTVSTPDDRVGDNDRLAAKVAEMIDADHLIILTSVDGLYDRDPSDPEAQFISELTDVNQYMANTEQTNGLGSGGMKTKLQAANMAQQWGCLTHIAQGIVDQPVSTVLKDQRRHTKCLPLKNKISRQDQWITNRLQVNGAVVVDPAVTNSLTAGTVGDITLGDISVVSGEFNQGDVIHVFCDAGDELARGIAEFSSDELGVFDRFPDDVMFDLIDRSGNPVLICADNMMLVKSQHIKWEAPL